jgi:hypothetical protein
MQLFTRDSAEFNGTPSTDDAGRPVRFVAIACDRCHVINGQRLWIMGTENGQPYSRTGFDCWTCGNTGVRGERKERLYTAEQLARVNKTAATRAANKAEQERIVREQFLAAQDAVRAAFLSEHADFIAKVAALRGEDEDAFFNRAHVQLVRDLRAPTAALVQIVEAETAKRSANASSRWIGPAAPSLSNRRPAFRTWRRSGWFSGTTSTRPSRTVTSTAPPLRSSTLKRVPRAVMRWVAVRTENGRLASLATEKKPSPLSQTSRRSGPKAVRTRLSPLSWIREPSSSAA